MGRAASILGAMRITKRALLILPAWALIAATPGQDYVVDPARSEVTARVAFFGLGSKTARFPKVSGSIALSPDRPEDIDLRVSIDATMLAAPDSVTLARLRGPAFFDVKRYPTILFEGRRMEMSGERDAIISGQITARGVTRPATLAVRFAEPPRRAGGHETLALTGQTVIDRRAFGMTAYPLVVGRKVTIRLAAVLVRRK
jgi:polyisoprenoid-binding protein YceI